jgi:hypothetical protein
MRSWEEMAEDEQPKPVEPPADPPAEPPAAEAAVEPPKAKPSQPAAPPNKLHEWGAALGIMMFLALVLWMFLNFLRDMSI